MEKRLIIMVFAIFSFIVGLYSVSAANANVGSVCCEKTISGLYCQNVPIAECLQDDAIRKVQTSCESTSYCKKGYCYDSTEGTCQDNTPQIVCNANGGVWNDTQPAQCNLGCCILGDQAAFVTLTRCKKLSSVLGLKANFKKNIQDETQCVLSVASQERGACVYDFEFERTCKFTTRAECTGTGSATNGAGLMGQFYPDKLCSAEELGTNCGFTTKTTCVAGKDEVYFQDSCGNPANIYDSTKLTDKEYWSNVKTKAESCGAGTPNANNKNCGNCNYLLGSYCRLANSQTGKASYGDNICSNLNCQNTQNGKNYKHGESWCVFNDKGTTGQGNDAVGSRFYKHICINGEEVVEPCSDYRQEECIQDQIKTFQGITFSQAACRVNRWQDCVAQTDQLDCENADRRDCLWKADLKLNIANASSKGACLPKNTPGLQFWDGDNAKAICAQANTQCVVKYEKGLFGSGDGKCVSNCQCLTDAWTTQRNFVCSALGDCGPKINWLGDLGYRTGFNITISNTKKK
jgi:hypothetical protein